MMMITANMMISLRGLDKQKASASSTERSLAAQDATLDTLRSEIKSNSALASSMTSMIRTMSRQFSWFQNLLVSVKSMLSRGFILNLATYRAVLSIQESLSHSMDRTLIQDPFLLEDPLGRVAPVHLQFITSWKAFHAVLATRFEGLPGHEKVQRREFVLQERVTSREISRNEPWEIAFRSGALVCMSLVFQREVKTANSQSHCPHCGNISEKATTDDVHCAKCNMVYRRITEVTEVDQPPIPELPNYWSQQPSFGRTGFNNQPQTFGPFLKRKRTMESWEELSLSEEVRNFKRVRILSNIKKTRRAAFASWEDKKSWATTPSKQAGPVGCNNSLEASSTSNAAMDSGLRNCLGEGISFSDASFWPQAEGEGLRERVFANTPDSEEDDSSDSEGHVPGSTEDARDFKTGSQDWGRFAQVPEDDRDEGRLVEFPDGSDFKVPHDSGRCWIRADHLLLRDRYVSNLNAERARLLQYLPGGPILAPISKPLPRVLDIGPSNAWPSTATRHMPKAQIQNVQTWEHQTSRDLVYQLNTYEAGGYDLIHMQDWTVAANFLSILPQEMYRILRPGGWIEIEILQLQMQGSSCVQLQVYPFMIRHGLSSLGIKSFSTAEGIAKSFQDASFINLQSTVERIPIIGPPGHSDRKALGRDFRDLLLLMLQLVDKLADALSEPRRSSRLSIIREIRSALLDGRGKGANFMDLVRITAQKPVGSPDEV
ncbi:hypothetical protein F5883DRAFT_568977 [Diaporthe sp. PMI_573]|nr:hypothetical protein F5883DRAFT_568977 [Diaporthaceae sp. PMI_573]